MSSTSPTAKRPPHAFHNPATGPRNLPSARPEARHRIHRDVFPGPDRLRRDRAQDRRGSREECFPRVSMAL